MKSSIRFLVIVTLFFSMISLDASAQSKRRRAKPTLRSSKTRPDPGIPRANSTEQDLNRALQMAKAGQFQEASIRLFQLSYSPRYRAKRMQIKYILGLMLYQMKMNQVAAF